MFFEVGSKKGVADPSLSSEDPQPSWSMSPWRAIFMKMQPITPGLTPVKTDGNPEKVDGVDFLKLDQVLEFQEKDDSNASRRFLETGTSSTLGVLGILPGTASQCGGVPVLT